MGLERFVSVACCWVVAAALLAVKSDATGPSQATGAETCRVPAPKTSKGEPTKFKDGGGRGEYDTEYGIRMGFTDFTASDGIGLRVFYLAQDDRVQASMALDQEVSRAVQVFQLGEKRNAARKVVGKRARILAPSSKPDPPFFAVIWTDGATFHEIASSSMRDGLELEKVYRY